MKEIVATIRIDKLPSVNAMYEPILRFRRIPGSNRAVQTFHGMRLSDEARDAKSKVKEQLQIMGIDPEIKDIDWNHPFYLNIIYVLKQNILKRDLDNLNKCVIDGISEYFHLNDSRHFDESMKKRFYKGSNFEYIKFYLGQLDETLGDMEI